MRLLIVQDDPFALGLLTKSMRDGGYAVDAADNGESGLFKALSLEYDAIVLDVMLPGLNGWQVLEALRREKRTPVLILTACRELPLRIRALDLGADDYLVKPFDVSELLARIRALIRRSVGQAQPCIELGQVAINLRSRLASVNGNNVTLTSREYAILEYLALRRGQVISRTELYEHILDETDDTLSNLVDVHVSGIRKKLGHEVITTRRGQGYCIE